MRRFVFAAARGGLGLVRARFNRYCVLMDANSMSDKLTSENTIDFDEGDCAYKVVDKNHRNYDYVMEARVQPGKRFPAVFPGVPGARCARTRAAGYLGYRYSRCLVPA